MSNFLGEIPESCESIMGCVASLGSLNVKFNILREKVRHAGGQPAYCETSLRRPTLASGYLMLVHEPLMEKKQVLGNHLNSGDSNSKCSYEQTFSLVLHELSPPICPQTPTGDLWMRPWLFQRACLREWIHVTFQGGLGHLGICARHLRQSEEHVRVWSSW